MRDFRLLGAQAVLEKRADVMTSALRRFQPSTLRHAASSAYSGLKNIGGKTWRGLGKLFGLGMTGLAGYGAYEGGKNVAEGAEEAMKGNISSGAKRMIGGAGQAALNASFIGLPGGSNTSLVSLATNPLKYKAPTKGLKKVWNMGLGGAGMVGDFVLFERFARMAKKKNPALSQEDIRRQWQQARAEYLKRNQQLRQQEIRRRLLQHQQRQSQGQEENRYMQTVKAVKVPYSRLHRVARF